MSVWLELLLWQAPYSFLHGYKGLFYKDLNYIKCL